MKQMTTVISHYLVLFGVENIGLISVGIGKTTQSHYDQLAADQPI